MIAKTMKSVAFLSLFLFLTACGEETDVVESGTYTGVIEEVEPEKDEIYVTTEDDKTLELYFTPETELTRNGETADFSILEKGQQVEVTVEKVGQRLDPVAVRVLE